jgi:hypothetical protein
MAGLSGIEKEVGRYEQSIELANSCRNVKGRNDRDAD